MHQVIQKHLSVGEEAGAFEDGLALKAQFPVFPPRFVGRILQSSAYLGCSVVQSLNELSNGLELQGFLTALGEIQLGSCQNG